MLRITWIYSQCKSSFSSISGWFCFLIDANTLTSSACINIDISCRISSVRFTEESFLIPTPCTTLSWMNRSRIHATNALNCCYHLLNILINFYSNCTNLFEWFRIKWQCTSVKYTTILLFFAECNFSLKRYTCLPLYRLKAIRTLKWIYQIWQMIMSFSNDAMHFSILERYSITGLLLLLLLLLFECSC